MLNLSTQGGASRCKWDGLIEQSHLPSSLKNQLLMFEVIPFYAKRDNKVAPTYLVCKHRWLQKG
jgi:hypothetical protein